jgi:hypothetical protein
MRENCLSLSALRLGVLLFLEEMTEAWWSLAIPPQPLPAPSACQLAESALAQTKCLLANADRQSHLSFTRPGSGDTAIRMQSRSALFSWQTHSHCCACIERPAKQHTGAGHALACPCAAVQLDAVQKLTELELGVAVEPAFGSQMRCACVRIGRQTISRDRAVTAAAHSARKGPRLGSGKSSEAKPQERAPGTSMRSHGPCTASSAKSGDSMTMLAPSWLSEYPPTAVKRFSIFRFGSTLHMHIHTSK